jgi:serine/threonine protein kinase
LQGLCPKCLLKAAQGGSTVSSTSGIASDWQPPAASQLQARFPELEILEMIGRGGMGVVYKVRQKSLNRFAALKILPDQIAADPSFARRFEREAQVMARLNHPHIVSVYDNGQRQGLFFFVMEFIDGANLREVLEDPGIEPREALNIVPQICDALQYAHDRGVVHRDIKPENILLTQQGEVKITDFGIVKLIGAAPANLSVTQDRIVGTPVYMAPEQLETPNDVDHRADIYSLGVVFYQMLTGELPIGRFAPPSKRVEIDVRLDEVVLRSLEKQRERRYQQASQLKTRITTIASSDPVTTKASPSVLRRKSIQIGALAAVIAACVLPLLLHDIHQRGPIYYFEPAWKSIRTVQRVNDVIYAGGVGGDGRGRFGAFNTTTSVFTDLSSLLPASYGEVKALAPGNGHLLVAADKVGQIFWGQLGDFSTDSVAFHDLTDSMHAPFQWNWAVNAMAFDGNNYLVAGAGQATGLASYSPRTQWFTPLYEQIPYYFATNSIVLFGNAFLLVGAGASGPGVAAKPALGWISRDAVFRDLRSVVPPEIGTMGASAFDGHKILIQVFNIRTGQQMIELFDPYTNAFKDDSSVIPASTTLRGIAADNGRFWLAGQSVGAGYLAEFDAPARKLTVIDNALPANALDVTALTDSAGKLIVAGLASNGRVFIDQVDLALMKSATR